MIKDTVLDFVTNYGYYGLFLSLVLGIVGLPIPDEILMTYCGYLVSQSVLNYWLTLLTALIGSMTGITISYWMGRRFGLPVVERFGRRIGVTEARLEKVNGWYSRFGKIVLMIGYFIPGIRHVTAFAAGMSRMKYPPFALFAYLGGFIWSFTFITLGKSLGVHWTQVTELTHRFVLWFLLVLALGGIGAGVYYWRKRKLHTK
jgi:membrane protein DedA with SNARE-associated domain